MSNEPLANILRRAAAPPAPPTQTNGAASPDPVEAGLRAYHQTIAGLESDVKTARDGWRAEIDAHERTREGMGRELEREQTEKAMLGSQLEVAHAQLQDVAATKAENALLRSQVDKGIARERSLEGKLAAAKVYMTAVAMSANEGCRGLLTIDHEPAAERIEDKREPFDVAAGVADLAASTIRPIGK